MTENIISPSVLTSVRQAARMLAEAHLRAEERAKATHARFNIFTTLLRENDEVRLHTRFLHCLLDPNGFHDCGQLFLDLFFTTLTDYPGIDHDDLPVKWESPGADDTWKVRKEAEKSSGYGQIDLLLEHRQSFGIAIENKIHAREQDRQLASYSGFIRTKYRDNSRLIYLTLDGRMSYSHGGASYIRISYAEHILAWLDLCLEKTYHIIPVNQVILQYRGLVRKLTGNIMETNTIKAVAQFISANPDIIRFRDQLSEAVDEAQSTYLDALAKGITDSLHDEYQVRLAPGMHRFGMEDIGHLIIRASNGMPLLQESMDVYVEYEPDEGLLAVGVFVGYDQIQLSAKQSLLIARIKESLPMSLT